jgi:hypothetical protein
MIFSQFYINVLIKQNLSFPLTIMKSKFHNTYEKYDYNITLRILRNIATCDMNPFYFNAKPIF